jgi:DNA-binding transcriptional MocR family regulator
MIAPQPAVDWSDWFAARVSRMRASEIRELLKLLENPDVVSFAGGIPDPALFPMDAIRAAYADILADPQLGGAALQYSVSEGYGPLRQWIAGYMGRRGVPCELDNIVITSGSQQGLDFIAKLFVHPGDTVLVQEPTYLGALQAFNAYEPQYDLLFRAGATAEDYRKRAAANGGRVALAYVVSDFANPSGETLTAGERQAVLDLGRELDVPVLEDAAYEALRFDGEPVTALAALDVAHGGGIDRSRVIYCGTFSKTVCPGLRVGWICAARDIAHKIVLAKQGADLHSATINQMVVHRIASTMFDQHVATLLPPYRRRRDAMLAALAAHMPAGVRWSKPEGGMFVWITLPEGVDGAELLERSLLEERIGFVPGGAFSPHGDVRNTIRLNYSLQPEAAITEGVARLGALVSRYLSD